MKNLREYVRLIFTAVICLFLSMKKGRAGKNPAVGFAGAGNLFGSETWGMSGCREAAGATLQTDGGGRLCRSDPAWSEKRRCRRIQEKFFWLKGPGDRPRPDGSVFCADSA